MWSNRHQMWTCAHNSQLSVAGLQRPRTQLQGEVRTQQAATAGALVVMCYIALRISKLVACDTNRHWPLWRTFRTTPLYSAFAIWPADQEPPSLIQSTFTGECLWLPKLTTPTFITFTLVRSRLLWKKNHLKFFRNINFRNHASNSLSLEILESKSWHKNNGSLSFLILLLMFSNDFFRHDHSLVATPRKVVVSQKRAFRQACKRFVRC